MFVWKKLSICLGFLLVCYGTWAQDDANSQLLKRPAFRERPTMEREKPVRAFPSPERMVNPFKMQGERPSGFDRPPSSMFPRMPSSPMTPPSRFRSSRGGQATGEDLTKVVPQKCVPAKGELVWNFENEMLANVIKQVGDLLCINILLNPLVNPGQKLTILGKTPMTVKDVWTVLMASLSSMGLSMVEQGKTWFIIKREESKNFSSPLFKNASNVPNNEGIGTLFYKTKHASPDDLRNLARPLVSPRTGVVETVGERFVMIIDSNSNLRRMQEIFKEIDVEDAVNKVYLVKLNHADPKTLTGQLNEIFNISQPITRFRRRPGGPNQAEKGGKNIEKIIEDERTGSLIIVCDKTAYEELSQVISILDQPVDDNGGKGNTHVIRLKHANAEDVAKTINEVVSETRRPMRPFPPPRRPGDEQGLPFEGQIKVTHSDNNQIVVVASTADLPSVLSLINKLDARRDQVFMEAAIFDISTNDTKDFGIDVFSGFNSPIAGLGGLGVLANPGGRDIASGVVDGLKGAALGADAGKLGALAVLGNFLSGGILGFTGGVGPQGIPSFGAVLKAVSTNNKIDVLMTPYLLTTDNKEAVMKSGQKVPVIRGAQSVGAGQAGSALGIPVQNISYENVDLTFKVTPHVGDEGNVRLDIEQEVNEIGVKEKLFGDTTQNRINTKSIKTTIVLKDQQTGVIGGLTHLKTSNDDRKVPFLGDIPILGWLFKSRETKNDRKNLMLVITPYIIKTEADYKKLYDRKMKEREEFAKLYYGGKIKTYDPYVDYDKKSGPLGSLLAGLDEDMQKKENFGPGAEEVKPIAPQPTLKIPMPGEKSSEPGLFNMKAAEVHNVTNVVQVAE